MDLPFSRARLKELIDGQGAAPFDTDEHWDEVRDVVFTWFVELKAWESSDTWADAFKERRMTMRAILEDRQTGFYTVAVPIKGQEDKGGVRTIRTMQGIPGIEERMRETNFRLQPSTLKSLKNDKGLHDMSGVLIDPARSLKIGGDKAEDNPSNQIYRATGDATYAFMPVCSEADHVVFHQLNVMAKTSRSPSFRAAVRLMRSRLTRIKVAFDDDAGCKFIDLAPEGEAYLPRFRYGHTGLKKVGMGKVQMTDGEIALRRDAALKYTSVLTGKNRNEIVIAYRQHGLKGMPSRFPMYAKHVFDGQDHRHYKVIDRTGRELGQKITLNGQLQ